MAEHDIGQRLIAALITCEDEKVLANLGDLSYLLVGSEVVLYEFVMDHLIAYKKMPSPETILKNVDSTPLPEVSEGPLYFIDKLRGRLVHNGLSAAFEGAKVRLKTNEPDTYKPFDALELVKNAVTDIILTTRDDLVTDFRDVYDIVMGDYVNKWTEGVGEEPLMLGWPTLDNMTNGLVGGDLLSLVGRPSLGKTFLLLYSAMNVWEKQRRPVVFVSTEMSPLLLHQRMASMHVKKPFRWFKASAIPSKSEEAVKNSLMMVGKDEVPLYVIDGKLTSTVQDIAVLSRHLEPAMIIIDGAYMLRHPNRRLGRYERVAENCELLKQLLATDLDVPVIASWQFSKEAAKLVKKKKTEEVGLEHIGYSDVIGEISSVVLAMFEPETLETLRRRRIEVLKGRSGEVGRFYVRWEFTTMNFSEIGEKEVDPFLYV